MGSRLGVVGFELVHLRAPKDRRVHSVSCGFTRALLKVSGFIRVRVGSLGCALVSTGSLGFAWVHSCAPRCRRVHWGSSGVTRALLVVAGLIAFCVGSLERAEGSHGFTCGLLIVVEFIQRRVVSLVLLKPAGFIRISVSVLARV